eukprot:10970116-Heterocapsa_arctica.AAC.1
MNARPETYPLKMHPPSTVNFGGWGFALGRAHANGGRSFRKHRTMSIMTIMSTTWMNCLLNSMIVQSAH